MIKKMTPQNCCKFSKSPPDTGDGEGDGDCDRHGEF